jgi:hypothetical protein
MSNADVVCCESFSTTFKTRLPPSLAAAVGRAADAKLTTVSEYVRQALLTALRADGIELQEQQFALVAGGEFVLGRHGPITTLARGAPTPDERGVWVLIENEDSEPFNPVAHWRLKPTMRVDGARVVRTYPVVAKAWEHA